MRQYFEMWLSLVERCVRDAEAAGSNPVISTMLNVHNGLDRYEHFLFCSKVWGIREHPNKCGYPSTMLAKKKLSATNFRILF